MTKRSYQCFVFRNDLKYRYYLVRKSYFSDHAIVSPIPSIALVILRPITGDLEKKMKEAETCTNMNLMFEPIASEITELQQGHKFTLADGRTVFSRVVCLSGHFDTPAKDDFIKKSSL